MSGIAGILAFEDGAADPAVVRRMLDAMAHRGAEDEGLTACGCVAFGHRVRWTTNEARQERQPLASSDGRWLVTYDGRLDNPDEIRRRLDLPASFADGTLMAELVAREGPDALARCIGEYALSAWNGAERRLALVRDSLGMRPLYYAVTPRGLLWASEPQAILLTGWIDRRPHEGFIAEYLTTFPYSLEETPLAGVLRLPQAHLLEAIDGRVARRRYWSPACHAERRVSDVQAVEEFRDRLATAVRACLRASTPVAFQVSGGLDSSSIVGLASREGVRHPAAFSLVVPGDPAADETAFIDKAVRFFGATSRRFEPPADAGASFEYVLRHEDLPHLATGEPLMTELLRGASTDGHRVMLTGLGADQWLMFGLFRTAQLLQRGRVLGAARYALSLRSVLGAEWRWRSVAAAGVLPLVPEPLKARVRPWLPRRDEAPWIRPEFARRVGLDQRLRASLKRAPRVSDPVLQDSLVRLTSGEEAAVRHEAERMGTHAGIELRHPYYDRRVVEYVLSLRDDLRFRAGQSKYLSRLALADVLPPSVAQRSDKANLSGVMLTIVRAASRQTNWHALRSAELGWIDAARIQALRRDLESPGPPTPQRILAGHAVWCVAGLEAWLRRVF